MYSFADRGLRKKSKNSVSLNVTTHKNGLSNSISYNLKQGLKATGFIPTQPQNSNKEVISNGIKTFQKGNTIYLVPQKTKIVSNNFKPGFTGMKFTIKNRD
jgi:hypothetical protein